MDRQDLLGGMSFQAVMLQPWEVMAGTLTVKTNAKQVHGLRVI